MLLRAGVGAAFVALARRGERLTGALTLELDKAERDEQDPDRLARLFVLDHLAARMTRNNESLLVLGGEGTVRVRDEGVPLIDVIRGAAGRIERYSRVDLVNVDLSVVVAPPAWTTSCTCARSCWTTPPPSPPRTAGCWSDIGCWPTGSSCRSPTAASA